MSEKYICLLSGGLDSVVNLHLAHRQGQVIKSITFDYSQRSAHQEIKAAAYFAESLNIAHEVIDIKWLGSLTKTALVNKSELIPKLKNLDDLNEGLESASKVWVPNRNGVFLNIAASFAESLKAQFVVPGFNKEEAATFPDNSEAFIEATNKSFQLSTLFQVKVKCFTTHLDKLAMVRMAKELGINMKKLWSCYEGFELPCETCESCQRTLRALDLMGI